MHHDVDEMNVALLTERLRRVPMRRSGEVSSPLSFHLPPEIFFLLLPVPSSGRPVPLLPQTAPLILPSPTPDAQAVSRCPAVALRRRAHVGQLASFRPSGSPTHVACAAAMSATMQPTTAGVQRLIVDTDCGVDDAQALMLAFAHVGVPSSSPSPRPVRPTPILAHRLLTTLQLPSANPTRPPALALAPATHRWRRIARGISPRRGWR